MDRYKRGSLRWLSLLLVGVILGAGGASTSAQFQDAQEASELSNQAIQSVSGERSTWNGFSRIDFSVDGRKVTVVEPQKVRKGRPWVWHGEFFGHRPIPDIALLGRGHHIVFAPFSDQFGGPPAIAHWEKVYQQLIQHFSLSPQSALVGTSRGGLYCYNWAARYPERVSCIFGDAPVCDLKSWPLGMGTGTRSEAEVAKLLAVYGVEDVHDCWKWRSTRSIACSRSPSGTYRFSMSVVMPIRLSRWQKTLKRCRKPTKHWEGKWR